MAHLHTAPGDHDVCVSALVLRKIDGEWKALVLQHRILDKVLQPGGHVEHDEDPWAAMAHELKEETGYAMSQLAVLQPLTFGLAPSDNRFLPVPLAITSVAITPDHAHDDLIYAFVTDEDPVGQPGPGESQDLFWCSPDELRTHPNALAMLPGLVEGILERVLPTWERVPATGW